MTARDLERVVILGNGGSGKSWLAGQIAATTCAETFDLDFINWLPGGYDTKRDRNEALTMVREIVRGERWIVEGSYGWLAEEALLRATTLVFLDIPEAECIANARARGLRHGASQESFEALIAWIGEYRIRQNANSFAAHKRLFDDFPCAKIRLCSREEIAAMLSSFAA